MHAAQLRLIPDARPLVDRLGSEFFRRIPQSPGVYLIRDASHAVLYVGKARNLRNRLRSYRVANPELLPRRRLRLLHLARHVEWQITADEPAATARERDLLLELKPRFNRAGVWIPQPRLFGWRVRGGALEFSLLGAPAPDWKTHRPRGASARQFRAASVRMAWIGWNAHRGPGGLPAGWFEGRLPEITILSPGAGGLDAEAVEGLFERLTAGEPGPLMDWIEDGIRSVPSPFLQAWIAADLDTLFPGIAELPRDDLPGSLPSDPDPRRGNPVVDQGDPLHVTPPP